MGSLRSRYAVDDGNSSISDWIIANTTLKGKPFSFEKYAFQKQIADDEHRNLVCRKCSQVGLTETQLRKFLAMLMRTNGLSGIFTLPSDEMYKRIWDGRLKPMLDSDGVFKPRDDDDSWTKRKGMFQLDHSLGYVTGCGEDDATSTPADFLMHDELDLSPMDMIALYQSRLQNSDYKIRQSFSTPTHIDYGIDGSFKTSDQHEFFIKCDCCGEQQLPEFTPQYVRLPKANTPDLDYLDIGVEQLQLLNLEDSFVACRRCNAPLDLGNGNLREWVPRYPERTQTRGYQVTPFTNNRVSILDIFTQLAEYKRLDNIKGFHNTVLGQPFTPANARLKRAEVEACFINDVPTIDGQIHLGVDLGQTCHVVMLRTTPGGGVHAFYWATVAADNLLEHIRDLREQYPGLRGAGDRLPYTTEMNAIRNDSHRMIWPVNYTPGNTARIRPVKESDTGEVDYYTGNRTAMIDYAAGMIRRKRVAISGADSQKEVLVEHFCDMVRDEQPEKPATWVKLTGNDHYMHAFGFALFSMRIAESEEFFSGVAPGSIVLTQGADGWGTAPPQKRVYDPFARR